MIDRVSRDKLAETLRQYVSGRITNYTLDDLQTNNKDQGVKAISHAAWFLYDDLHEHKAVGNYKLDKENKHDISKCIVFLQSNEEYLWSNPSIRQNLITIFTFGLYKKISLTDKDGDVKAWPFFKNKELKNAQKNPKLLAGNAQEKY